MPQFLVVYCARQRTVLIGGIDHGFTGDLIELPASGRYTVTLQLQAGDIDCQPPWHIVELLNTNALFPKEITFDVV